MATNPAEQITLLEQKIIEEQTKSKERIAKLIDKEKDTTKLVKLIDDEKTKTTEKVNQLKAQKRAIESREQVRKRKERTRRLIQHGALAEKYLNCEGVSTETFEATLKEIVRVMGDFKRSETK